MLKLSNLTSTRTLAFIGRIFILIGLSGLGLIFVFFLYPSHHTPRRAYPTSITLGIDTPLGAPWFGDYLMLEAIITLPPKPVLYQSAPLIVSIVPGNLIVSTPVPDNLTPVPFQYDTTSTPSDLLGVQLSASAFNVDPQEQPLQHMNGSDHKVNFDWTITPKYTGDQTLIITISAPYWAPNSPQQGESSVQVLTTQVVHLLVNDPVNSLSTSSANSFSSFFSSGEATLGALLVTLLGSGLNIPWIVELLRKRREAKEKKQEAQFRGPTNPTNISISDISTSPASPTQLPFIQTNKAAQTGKAVQKSQRKKRR